MSYDDWKACTGGPGYEHECPICGSYGPDDQPCTDECWKTFYDILKLEREFEDDSFEGC